MGPLRGEGRAPQEAVDKKEGEELPDKVGLELGGGAVVLPVVERGGEAVEDVPVEELDQEAPSGGDEYDEEGLEGGVLHVLVDGDPERVEARVKQAAERQLRP